MRRFTVLLAPLAALVLPVALAVPAQAAGSGSLTDLGNGTVRMIWSGIPGSPPMGNVLFCPTSIAPASCNFTNFTYAVGGWVPLPSSGTVLGVGTTVRERVTSTNTTLPDGTFNMVFYDNVPASIATLTNAVIGTGVTPSGGSASTESSPPQIVQQFGRPTSGTCEAVANADLNWGGAESGGWSESWAEWMNGGLGGAVCTRTLTYRSSTGVWSAA